MVEISRALNWLILCDWDRNGYGLTAPDDISARVDIKPGITATRGRDPTRSLGEPRIPALQLTGVNDDRFFSYEWPGSALYGKATTGAPLGMWARVGESYDANAAIDANSAIYANGTEDIQVFAGLLDRVTHQARYEDRRVTLRGLGNLIKLRDRREVSTALYSNLTTGEAMALLLTAMGLSAAQYVISGCGVTLAGWWLDRADPYTAAVELWRTEGPGAALYEDETGRIVFEGQNYRVDNARCLTAQASFLPDSSGIMFADPEHEDGAEHIINEATYHVKQRSNLSTAALWSYGPAFTLGANETRFFNWYATDPIVSLVSPLVATTDYVLTSGTLSQATVTQQNANLAVVTITAGAGGAIVTGLQVRGVAWGVVNEFDVENSVSASASIATYGTHARAFTGRAEIDQNVAISICDTAVQRYMTPRAVNRFAILGTTGEYIRQGITRQISDRIHYRQVQTGQDIDAWIESIEHKAVDGLLVTTIGCERTIAQGYGRYDSGVYDTAIYGQ